VLFFAILTVQREGVEEGRKLGRGEYASLAFGVMDPSVYMEICNFLNRSA